MVFAQVSGIKKPGGNAESLYAQLCPASLTMEGMSKNRLQWYVEKLELLPPTQFGFRVKRSTMDVIIPVAAAQA